MKMRNLISGIGLIVVGLFSCTSEEEIGPTRSDASLSVVLSVGDAKTTKADAAKGYEIATADEIKINDFYIAIFRSDGTKIEDKIVANTSSLGEGVEKTTVNNFPGYKVSFQDIPVRYEKVFALIVANASSLYSTFQGNTKYKDYQSGVISTLSENFVADKLAKFGVSQEEALGQGTTILTVGLTQLSARIDFGTVKTETKAITEGDVKIEETESDFSVFTKSKPEEKIFSKLDKEIKKDERPGGTWTPYSDVNAGKRYKYEKISDICNAFYYSVDFKYNITRNVYTKRLNIVRKKVTTKTTTTQQPTDETEGSFNISRISCTGINGKTNAILNSRNSQYGGIELGSLRENTSFYTYEYPEGENNLTLTITGKHTSGSSEGSGDVSITETTKWVYGIWEQNRGNGWTAPGSIDGKTKNITWFDGKDGRVDISEEIQQNAERSLLKSGETVYVVKWTDIKDDHGNPVSLEHGYRYGLSVKVEQNQFKVIVAKLPWSSVELDPTYDSSSKK